VLLVTPIPNKDPRCKCVLGKMRIEPDAVEFTTSFGFIFTAYRDCPLHGETVQSLVKSGLKGLSLDGLFSR